jgi:TRAP transporter TAXI family solute receptor
MRHATATRQFLRRHWLALVLAAIGAAVFAAAVLLLRTMPPSTITMATGSEGGAYHEVGKFYQTILARSGVELKLLPTGGSVENLELLRNPRSGVDVALVQSGNARENDANAIESLGTLFYEPLWLFYRGALGPRDIDTLQGLKVATGPEGSGSRVVALELLKRSGADRQVAELVALTPQVAGEKLLNGEIDAALMLVSWDSPVVKRLLDDERIELASFRHADAYVALFPYLSKVRLPAGVADLAKKRPADDTVLVAPKASLLVQKDLSTAIQYLLLNTAVQIHSGPGIFQFAGQFPAAEAIDIPLSDEALQFYKSGRPFLNNFMPFWMAALIGRLLVVLIPLIGVLYPLMRFMPAVYDWGMRRKITRIYGELRFLEAEMETRGTQFDPVEAADRLDRLERQANQLKMPIAYASMLYLLRNHIALVRSRLGAAMPSPAIAASDAPHAGG